MPPRKTAHDPLSDEAKRAKWPASTIAEVPIKELIPYARNARTHSQSQILQIARSMEERGWTSRVLRDERNEIIAGHGRVLGAEVLVGRGKTEFSVAPVMTAIGWTTEQKRAYVIADNQLALQAGWDSSLLQSELRELSAAGFQMELLGFSARDLRAHLGQGGGKTDPDAAPEIEPKTVSRLGDLWILGGHRVLCGDATSKIAVSRLFSGAKAALMVTDPPYGVKYDPQWRVDSRTPLAKTNVGKVSNDHRADWTPAWELSPAPVAYVWHGGLHGSIVQQNLEAAGFEMRAQIIWRKTSLVLGRGDYHWQHEPCFYVVRKGAKSSYRGGRKQTTVWDIAGLNPFGRGTVKAEDVHTDHSTQKPVECMQRPIENNTVEGEIIYDPFLGSGSTIIAAERCQRACYGLELDPAYVDLLIRRWQEFTGKAALLDGRQLSFVEIESERAHGKKRPKAAAVKRQGPARQRGRGKPDKPARAEATG